MNNSSVKYHLFSCLNLFVVLLLIVSEVDVKGRESYEIGKLRVFENHDFSFDVPVSNFTDIENNQVSADVQGTINKINALAKLVEEEGRFIDRLDALQQVTYPIGITKVIGGKNYTIVLDSDEITTEGAYVTAYMSFPIPQTGRQLAFIANKIPLSAEGGINGVVELTLMADEPVNMGDNSRLIVYGMDAHNKTHTKVRFDCNGFVDMVIDAGIEFNPNIFVAEDPKTGNTEGNGALNARFSTTIQSWDDLIVEVSLPPFQMKGLNGFGFEVQQASFDFSDLNNPAGIKFPENYRGMELYGDLHNLWQGFYFRQLVVRFPPELGEGERLEMMAQNMIIDEEGLSGTFAMNNLLSLENGTIGGWAFSIDQIGVELVSGSVTEAGMKGKLTMPIMKDSDYMDYSAVIDQGGEFLFSASMPKDFDVPMFAAKMNVNKSSSITIQKEKDKYAVLANLNGKISISSSLKGDGGEESQSDDPKGFKVDDLRFEKMQIGSMAPYFKPGVWSLGEVGYSKANGFSLVMSNVEGVESGNDVGIKFTATVKLSGEKYVASTTLKVMGTRYSEVDGELVKHKLKYKSTEIQDLYIKVSDAAISLEGYLAIYKNDKTYGDGYAGMIKADIIGKFGVEVKAVFGEVQGFKYWYVDALANFSATPLPMFPGVSLYGIGGGAYHHMSQKDPVGLPFSNANINQARNVINYVPDKTVFLGFKATVVIGSPSPQGFNATATFEIVFNSNWGVNEVMFYGQGKFMQPMDMENPNTPAPIQADVYLKLDFVNDVLYGNFKVYVNAANGMLTGINPGNLAGEMVIYSSPSDWYVHIGRPSARIGLKLEVFGITVQNGSYFMMGTQIEPMPPPPDQVLQILDMPMPNNRNTAEMAMAKGFAFGTYFSISTGDKRFGIFYASFDMGLGFDVMLSDKGETYCVESGQKIGMNGWYAEGQLYAYVKGAIGIDVKVFKINVHQEILDVGAAVLLEAKLPNPFWMRGTVGGYYSLLGGRLKGNCKFQLEIGNQCTLKTVEQETVDPVTTLTAISELSPANGRSSIDVFSTPQAVFNYQINRPFRISDKPGSGKFKVVLDDFAVKVNGVQVVGEYKWNGRGDVLTFNPRDLFPGKKEVALEAKVHFEQYTKGGWIVIKDKGQDLVEIISSKFTTAEAPKYIPASNVAHSYPMVDMMNLYRNEFSEGHIALIKGQGYLFGDTENWKYYAKFSPVLGGDPIFVNLDYDANKMEVKHIIPASLPTNMILRFELVSIPAKQAAGIDANISSQEISSNVTGGDVTKIKNTASSVRKSLQENILYTCHFRTSKFSSLSEKLDAVTSVYTSPRSVSYSPVVFNLRSTVDLPEPFDKYELEGYGGAGPLLKLWADKDGEWLADYQIPLIYADYPITEYAVISKRDTAKMGFIPVRAVGMDVSADPYRLLSQEEKSSGIIELSTTGTYISYNLSPITYQDMQDIGGKLALQPISHPRKTQILRANYPSIRINTTYPVNVQYRLPFMNKTGTQNKIDIKL